MTTLGSIAARFGAGAEPAAACWWNVEVLAVIATAVALAWALSLRA